MDNEINQLIEENINLACFIANKYYKSMAHVFEYEEMKSMCLEALVIAGRTFDSSKQVKFSTYAYNVIKNNVLSKYNWLHKKRSNIIISSLDEPQTDDLETLSSVLPSADNLELDYVKLEELRILYKYINELPTDLANIIKLHLKSYSFESIGKEIGKSSAYVYTQYQKALNILRYKFGRDGINEK